MIRANVFTHAPPAPARLTIRRPFTGAPRSLLTASLLGAALAAAAAVAVAEPPNVVLFLADDQGWTGTSTAMDPAVPGSASDYYRTPAIDRLASQGMRFSQAYSPHPNCSPTRMSIQTGKSPARLHSTDIVDVVPGTKSFISQFYDTAYVDKPLIMKLPIRDLPDGEVTLAEMVKRHSPAYVAAHFGKWHMNGGGPERHGYDESDGETTNLEGAADAPDPKRTPALTSRALAFLDQRGDDRRPFLLQISYWAVHTPIRATPESIASWEARASKTYVWEGGIRVPMIVRGPGVAAGAVSRTPVIGWDIFPTVAAWIGAGSQLPAGIDGGSLAALLAGDGTGTVERPGRSLVWFYPHYRNMKGVTPQAAIREGRYKLIVEYESGRRRPFDLEADLGESADLGAAQPEIAAGLAERLDRYLDAVGAQRPPVNPDYDPKKDKGLAAAPTG